MSNLVDINSIFSLGFRCNADDFLSHILKIRKYSSPFSYMIIDIKTALNFIDDKFVSYTNKDLILPGKSTLKFNNNGWSCINIHKYSIIPDDYMDILDLENVCIWNHHNLYEENILYAINRRSSHLLKCLNERPHTTLLLYIEKIQQYEEQKDSYFDKSILDKYNCNFLILIPLLDFNSDPVLFHDDSKVRIIYFSSNMNGWTVEIDSHREEWEKLEKLVRQLYDFNIEARNDDTTVS